MMPPRLYLIPTSGIRKKFSRVVPGFCFLCRFFFLVQQSETFSKNNRPKWWNGRPSLSFLLKRSTISHRRNGNVPRNIQPTKSES